MLRRISNISCIYLHPFFQSRCRSCYTRRQAGNERGSSVFRVAPKGTTLCTGSHTCAVSLLPARMVKSSTPNLTTPTSRKLNIDIFRPAICKLECSIQDESFQPQNAQERLTSLLVLWADTPIASFGGDRHRIRVWH
jgi:hypothetical protein